MSFSLFHLYLFIYFIYFFFHPEAPSRNTAVHTDAGDFDNEPHKRRNQILSVLFAVAAMLGYAVLSGIVTIHSSRSQLEEPRHDDGDEDDEEQEWIFIYLVFFKYILIKSVYSEWIPLSSTIKVFTSLLIKQDTPWCSCLCFFFFLLLLCKVNYK